MKHKKTRSWSQKAHDEYKWTKVEIMVEKMRISLSARNIYKKFESFNCCLEKLAVLE